MSNYNIQIQYPGVAGPIGGAIPAGTNGQMQFNDSGVLGGAPMTYDSTTGQFYIPAAGTGSAASLVVDSNNTGGYASIIAKGTSDNQYGAINIQDTSTPLAAYALIAGYTNGGDSFFIIDIINNQTFLLYDYQNVFSLGDGTTPILLNGPAFFQNITTVASLPSAGASARAFVNDSTVAAAGNFGAIVAGGGTHTVPVWTDGTNWYIG